ncbi:unnamed protein product, partial [Ectocarpus sp. 12 AP-2014]
MRLTQRSHISLRSFRTDWYFPRRMCCLATDASTSFSSCTETSPRIPAVTPPRAYVRCSRSAWRSSVSSFWCCVRNVSSCSRRRRSICMVFTIRWRNRSNW